MTDKGLHVGSDDDILERIERNHFRNSQRFTPVAALFKTDAYCREHRAGVLLADQLHRNRPICERVAAVNLCDYRPPVQDAARQASRTLRSR